MKNFDLLVSMPVLFLLATLIAASHNFSKSINESNVNRLLLLLLLLLLLPVDRLLSLLFIVVTEAVVR